MNVVRSFWSAGTWQKWTVIGVAVLVVGLFRGLLSTITRDFAGGSIAPETTPAITVRPVISALRLGGQLADFSAAFGTMLSQTGNTFNFNVGNGTTVSVTISQGTASSISVFGPENWSRTQTFNACASYLPTGAVKFNQSGTYTDFHSGLSEVIINTVGNGTCLLYLAAA